MNKKGGEKLTGLKIFSIAVDVATIIVDTIMIIYITRRWQR